MSTGSKIILLYDGDSIAYRAAAVTEARTVKIVHKATGKEKEFKTRTEHKKALIAKGKEYNKDHWEFTDIQTAQPVANTLAILKNQVKKINETLFADEYLICLSGKSNFRDDLPLPSKYKGSRVDLMRPIVLKEAKHYLWKNHPSLLAKHREADDDLIIKGYEYLNKGYTVILISQDKDAYAYTGLTLYDYTQEHTVPHEVPEFGSLWDTGDKITGEGFIWFCFQWVNGDPSDDYKPCELAGVKYGRQSAYNLLKDCTTEKEALDAVVSQYKLWYPEPFTYTAWDGTEHTANYASMLSLYFKCARMMTTEDDNLDAMKFLADRGVVL
jgi:hypothetical protein